MHGRTKYIAFQSTPTLAEQNIEAARQRTLQTYHVGFSKAKFGHWSSITLPEPHIMERLQDLYKDLNQTNRQNSDWFVAKSQFDTREHTGVNEPRSGSPSSPNNIFDCILPLYSQRLDYMQDAGAERMGLWSEWSAECRKPDQFRNGAFLEACESTIVFMEEDYIKRKLDFTNEVYALLEKHDPPRAKKILDDLEALWPWTKADFIMRLETFVAGYDGVERGSA
ncbi:hypothetical protein FB567DRAFT_444667 [Paraphoma chrysanthemicola]|uniref:Uncharacterized protein n=1 Tax=Paraphoma chrysanthemicola TaxID=798071 RepID=A0A8K0R4G1_9PLEO|nr:hypothetical protein FB567DRAFT_444667 [Paraphoma chrysanthemicola]